jgi:ethanolamine utilization protein EutA (predicted chaperonin)
MKQFLLFLVLCIFQTQLFGQENFVTNINECIPQVDTIDGQEVYNVVDSMPEYITEIVNEGPYSEFQRAIMECTKLPDDNSLYYGLIFFTFIVDTSGMVRNECIPKSIIRDDILYVESEILETLRNMKKWKVGILNNKKVPVRITQKIKLGL